MAYEPLEHTNLFTPIKIGDIELGHRIGMAPLTRNRAHYSQTPSDLAITYYTQRASYPGTLLITEGTFIAKEASGMKNVPGLWNAEHIAAWKKITDAVHSKGSFIFCQLWALGRAASPEIMAEYGFDVVSSSDVPITGRATPRPLTVPEIKKYVEYYAQAAKNAVAAGFDGVELHSANGYLPDQFIQDLSNKRTDEYGGSIENRCRFVLEILEAVSNAIGQKKTGIRLSPWSPFQDMRMADPIPTFSYLAQKIKDSFPDFAYLHVTEARVMGNVDCEAPEEESNDFLRKIWAPKVFLSAGGFKDHNTRDAVPKMGDVIIFGRYFISNPDLPLRLKKGIPLTKYNRPTFYLIGPDQAEGYTDYPTAEEQQSHGKL